jgi:glucokinase
MILSGDIGGTKANLAIFEPLKRGLKLVCFESYLSREHANLEEIVGKFMSLCGVEVEVACFGIAGPVKQRRSETTNLAWVVDARRLARKLRLDFVGLINDLEANAWGIAALRDEDFFVLQQGRADKSGMRRSFPPEPAWVKRGCAGMATATVPSPAKVVTATSPPPTRFKPNCWAT